MIRKGKERKGNRKTTTEIRNYTVAIVMILPEMEMYAIIDDACVSK